MAPDHSTSGPESPEHRAKLFRNGGSQAVRLPQAYAFAGEEVRIRCEGERVILEPIAPRTNDRGWPDGYFARLDELGPSAIQRPPQPPTPEPDRW